MSTELRKDGLGQTILPVDQSLTYICNMLADLSGNGMGTSYLNVSSDAAETDLGGVEDCLKSIKSELEPLSNIDGGIDEIQSALHNLNGNVELIMMNISSIAESLESIAHSLKPKK